MIVFEFSDGFCLPAFDAILSDVENENLARAVALEGRRRKRDGLGHHGRLRALYDGEILKAPERRR